MAESPHNTQVASGSYIAQAAAGGIATVHVYERIAPLAVDQAALTAAQGLLAGLPLERIPDVAVSLPLCSRMPLRRNPLFVGREDELQALGATLKDGGKAAVSGMGGVGKTQLACEFVHRYGPYFAGGVFWGDSAIAAFPARGQGLGRSGWFTFTWAVLCRSAWAI